ncbi:MAG: nickel-dependent hydrogenase large subunit [Nitrospinae bacterium]|nr:nickel-dependent hydrogenase large subunit [Nitrospinota bacterium]
MGTKLVIDPVTRIEGHLRIEVEIENGKVKNAWSSGTMFRGFEIFLKDRDPRDAWYITQRVCGVCTTLHALTSVIAVENAVGIETPDNARLIRNLILGAQYLHDHIVHFYHLHALDWVDVVSALRADPKKTADLAYAINPHAARSGAGDFKAVQDKVKAFVNSGQLGPFDNAYWGHPAYKLPAEVNLLAVSHYLDALVLQAKAARLHAILGGKNPHPQSYVVGGMTCVQDLNPDRLAEFIFILKDVVDFANNVYIPDVMAVAPFYKEWAGIGAGLGNYLAYGMMPEDTSYDPKNLYFPRGIVMNRDLGKVVPLDVAKITENVAHSFYEGDGSLHPSQGETKPYYTGIDTGGKYSWLKSPRYDEKAMEVGPLSRMLVGYASGQKDIQAAVNDALKKLGLPATILFSTLGRTAARALETKVVAGKMDHWIAQLLENIKSGNMATWTKFTMPDSAQGFGMSEAPRGALGHWVDIKGGRIHNYQLVVPTTWNGSPRDKSGQRGAFEEALIGTPVADPKRPLEILRTIHSFDPCLACSVHVIDPKTNEVYETKVV